MNYELPIIANASSVEGRVFVVRGGVEQALLPDMALQADDVIRTTGDSIATISIPGTQSQIPTVLEVSNGAKVTLGFDQGSAGVAMVSTESGPGEGEVNLIAESEGENYAALLDGEQPVGEMSGLFGAGILSAGAGIGFVPLAGAAGAAAIFAGGTDDDDQVDLPNETGIPAESAGGLSETVTDLTDNLSDLVAPIPVVSDVVDAVGGTLDAVLVGDNNGGLGGILTGLGDGLAGGLDGTPLEPLGNVLDTLLGTIGGGLGFVADQVSSFGDNTPLEPLADLLGDILGRRGENSDGGVGGVVGTLTNVTDGLAQLLQPVPLLGELTGALDTVVDSIAFGNNDGGLAGVLSGLGGGLQESLASTPLALIGEGGNTLLNTVGGLLGGVGDLVTSLGATTPVAPVTDLVGDLAGSLSGDVSSALANIPFLGEALDELTSGLGGGGSLLGDLPLIGGLLDGGGNGGLLGGIPVVGDLLGGLTSSISSTGGAEGGLLGGLPLIGDLTRSLS